MNTPIRDMYISVLEKRAAEAVAPDYGIDNQAVANGEVASNNKDQRAQLVPLLEAAKGTESADTKHVGKLLPIAKKNPDTSSSNPLLKVAMHEAFFAGVRRTEMLKTAELGYLRTAYQGFEDEMKKVGSAATSLLGAAKKPLAQGSVVSKLPTRGGGLTRHGAPAPRKAALTLAEEARFSKAPKQVGSGVWKLAMGKEAGMVDSALKGVKQVGKKIVGKGGASARPGKAWGPGTVLQGSAKQSNPGTVNWGKFANAVANFAATHPAYQ